MEAKDLVDLGGLALFAFAVLRELRWFRKDVTTALETSSTRQVAIMERQKIMADHMSRFAGPTPHSDLKDKLRVVALTHGIDNNGH